MVRILARVEANSHRQSLHDLDVIAGGVFGRQQAVEFTSRARQPFDIALVNTFGGVDVNRDRLAAVHPAQLCLAKISGDPDVAERNHSEQLLAWLHALSYLYRLVIDYSGGGRDDVCITQVKLGLIQRSLSG